MLRDVPLEVLYAGAGREIANQLLLPALANASRYDRLSGFFTVGSLVSIGQGLDSLQANGGRMRLVVGAHDLDPQLIEATKTATVAEVVATLRLRVLRGVSKLSQELERDRIEAVAWMIRDGMLEVKCARVARLQDEEPGIFHSKRLIFVDALGDVVSATGSPNETVSGLGGNYEEVTVLRSWAGGEEYTTAHQKQFEAIWEATVPDLEVVDLDPTFGAQLLDALGVRARPVSTAVRLARPLDVLRMLRHSPLMAPVISSDRPLFPHQERVLIEATSRWPIRAVMADEVGLGKTYEAAAVIRFAVRFLAVRRVVVLVPPSLIRQWQDELADSFGMDFWRYDSARREFISTSGAAREATAGPFGPDYPSMLIVSRDLARGTRRTGHAFSEATVFPDMIVLDEAHAARKRRTPGGTTESLLRRMMVDLTTLVPHLLFLTATPMQMDASELRDLLALLSLPPDFDDEVYQRSLSLLSRGTEVAPDMQEVAEAVRLLNMSDAWYAPQALRRDAASRFIDTEDGESSMVSRFRATQAAREAWSTLFEGLVRFHPAAVLVLRNTRGALEQIGYEFPERDFKAVEPTMTPEVTDLLRALDGYLDEGLGKVERAIWSERSNSMGFLVVTYRQRIASSLRSAYDTLVGRSARIAAILAGEAWHEEISDSDEDGLHQITSSSGASTPSVAIRRACEVELSFIRHILDQFEDFTPTVRAVDPKMREAMAVLRRELGAGKSCLVFSKYTSTVRSLIDSFQDEFGTKMPFATYTGEVAEVFDGVRRKRASKSEVTKALDEDAVHVVFCSDAASEGLNLQRASVLINVDVPWNPARLEQRIGRIARLGQSSKTVTIVNLWYRGSVEKEIYSRLLARKELLDLAVGTYPEIVSQAIRQAVHEHANDVDYRAPDFMAELEDARSSLQLQALSRVWNQVFSEEQRWGGTEDFRRRLLDVLRRAAGMAGWDASSDDGVVKFTWAAGTVDVSPEVDARRGFTLTASWLEALLRAMPPRLSSGGTAPLVIIEAGDTPLLLGCTRAPGSTVVLRPDTLPEVIEALLLGTRLDLNAAGLVVVNDGDPTETVQSALLGWWPNPRAMTIPTAWEQGVAQLPAWADPPTSLRMKGIGAVPILEVGL